jgi:Hg(II)-responsive transcriptional regulator
MPERTLRTGEVAEAAGVNVETLRYYERRGLLKEPKRRGSGYREYPLETVQIIRFIKHAQQLGFTLDEIEELLTLRNERSRTCGEVRIAAVVKIEEIDRKIRSLHAIRNALSGLVTSCTNEASTRECPILEALDA